MSNFVQYKDFKFRQATLDTIDLINSIVQEYKDKGYDLTLRQVYYQLVARGYIPNNERSYKNLGNVLNDGRLAGMISWDSIVDRTRNLCRNSHWSSPSDIMGSVYYSYMLDKWVNQKNYVEGWVEKDALKGIVGSAASKFDVPYFSCRGYVSQSEMWSASQRFISRLSENKDCTIIHLGDHDPSGVDMSRDIRDRLYMFGADVEVRRVALTMEQIDTYCPPPNPTKVTDARAKSYIQEFGHECWELDALNPEVLTNLVSSNILSLIDIDEYNNRCNAESEDKMDIRLVSNNFEDCINFLKGR